MINIETTDNKFNDYEKILAKVIPKKGIWESVEIQYSNKDFHMDGVSNIFCLDVFKIMGIKINVPFDTGMNTQDKVPKMKYISNYMKTSIRMGELENLIDFVRKAEKSNPLNNFLIMLWAQGTKMHIVIYADNWSTGQFKFLARTSLDIEKGTFIGHLNAIYPGPYFLNALVFLKKLRKELKLNNGLVSLYANNDYPCDFEFQHGNDSYHIYIAPRRNPIDYLSDLEKSYKSIKWHIENKGEMLEVPNHV